MNIGINGFGRIGKTLFLQLINNKILNIKAVNAPDFNIKNITSYLKYDSIHGYNNELDIIILSDNCFKINNKEILLLNNRDPSLLNWKLYNINYVIDSTGVVLTQDLAQKHNADYVIMCAPPKDNTPQFIYNVNHQEYNGEKIISNASCTTNCITPVLKCILENNNIISANFTTIHSSTASQNVCDTINFKNRTRRSILNNIIPHTTGASKSISKVLPELENKIKGTSLRVPTSNVSIVDLNIKLLKKTSLEELFNFFDKSEYVSLEKDNLVSVDFISNECPSIVDKNASMTLFDNEFKLMIWYDNEWSYSYKVIKLVEYIVNYNKKKKESDKYFIKNLNYTNKNILLRVDWNVPIDSNGIIIDYYRIKSSVETIKYLLDQNPNYILIVSHLGRPKNNEHKYSWINYLDQINKYLVSVDLPEIYFLKDGVSSNTLKILKENKTKIYLLENIRFHPEEINEGNTNKINKFKSQFNQLGNIFVNDAFGCSHRNHISITGFKGTKSYGFLIEKELNALTSITNNINNDKILAIIGGAKIDDKLEMIKNLSKKIDGIYIAGGNINSIYKSEKYKDYLTKISKNRAEIFLMKDGLVSSSIDKSPNYHNGPLEPNDLNSYYDIGMKSIIELNKLIDKYDIIFWNGTLGMVEDNRYNCGSQTLVDILIKSRKKVIIGGGDTSGFVNKFNHNFFYVSTGGGASLEFLSSNNLIGLPAFL